MFRKLGLEIVKREKVHPAVQILAVVFGLLLAFVISGWIMSLTGSDPIESFKVMFRGAFGEKRKILNSLMRSTPHLLAALATVIAFKAEIWSIGQEGQIYAGAMMSFAVYRLIENAGLSRPVLLIIVVLAGALGGALLGGLAGWLRTRFKVDIIISTVLLNYIITTLLLFLLYDHKYWMGANNYYPRSDIISKDYWFQILGDTGRLHMGFIIAVALAIAVYWLIKRTPFGYDLRALGANPTATQFKGINVNRLILITMLVSGGLAGLAGGI